ncbi:MAG: hypothetical protein HOJ22_05775 [Chloroflexi bacterium]|jgi:hypothetical protein|nr:hypothetical protein [Chloroflexota bacterium]MBT5627783.1 hypothetical protein [Chloroflexota bacterium]
MTTNLDTNLLSAALDRVLPPVDDLAGAGAMGLAEVVVERSRADDRFWDALSTVMNALSVGEFLSEDGDGQDGAIRAVESSDPNAFTLWLDVVYSIYYMQPEVHKRLGWHGRAPQPEGNSMPPWDESILSNIRKREPFWRKV